MHLLVNFYSRAFFVGLLFFVANNFAAAAVIKNISSINNESLQAVQEKQAKKYEVTEKAIADTKNQVTSDRYTQSEAHVQVESVRKIITEQPSNMFIPYLNIMADCLAKEVSYKETHCVFYCGVFNQHILLQDLYKQLYVYYYPDKLSAVKDFEFMRYAQLPNIASTKGLIGRFKNGDKIENKNFLLPVNVALLGNIGVQNECAWTFFVKAQSLPESVRSYQEIMDTFGLQRNYIKDLMLLNDKYSSTNSEQVIMQIFIPKEKVDEIGVLVNALGIPIKKSEGDVGLNNYLKVYRSDPWKIKNINESAACLLFTADGLLNPESGIKIYRHRALNKNVSGEYHRDLNKIVEKIISKKEPQ